MSGNVEIRFYEELNDFLTAERRKVPFRYRIKQRGSIKDLIESLGVPHTEVDLILVDGVSVDFGYLVKDGDRISVYPVFEALDITPVTHLRPAPLRTPRFVLDGHLGRLAAYLRLLGFDTLYRNDYDDPTLARISADEHRILLTRDRKLLMRKQISHGYFVREIYPRKQLVEILERFDLYRIQQPFTRCMHCNGMIKPVEKSAVESLLPPRTRIWCNDFGQCVDCGKVYWRGAHFERLEQILQSANGRDGQDGEG